MEYIVEILRQNDEGLGIAKIDNIITFVDNTLIGEKVKIKITDKKKNYYIAKTVEVIEPSPNRRVPFCPYYNICGGCNIMHMKYDCQLKFKVNKVKNVFKKIYGKDIEPNIEYLNENNYRNKITLKIKDNNLGFFSKKTHDIVNINKCYISDDKINKVIRVLKEFIIKNNNHNISEAMIRIGNQTLLSIDKINNKLKKQFIEYMSKDVDIIYINKAKEYGNIQTMELFDLKFNVSPNSFFQVNTKMTEKLYKYVLDNINVNFNALDLYCGVGTITQIISKKCKHVIGIEVVSDAVNNARKNAKLNNIKNIEFICGKVEDNIDKIKLSNIDLVVLDPPRSGSDKKTLKILKEIFPKQIIYISCNPITLARDLKELDDIYELKSIELFDMFPNTTHVETISILKLK